MTPAIEVIGPMPTKSAYLCWVQRSIDRTGVPDMRIDGADSSGYRRAVASFKIAKSLPRDDRVDVSTQNRLIRLNHANRAYTAWIQAALIKAGSLNPDDAKESVMELPLSATRQAIYRFQEAVYKKDGMKDGGLKPDGWVGPKTEAKLREFSATDPPGGDGKPAPCKQPTDPKPWVASEDDRLAYKLTQAIDYIEEYESWDERQLCLARAMLRALRGGGLDDGYYTFRVFGRFGGEYDCTLKTGISALKPNPTQQHALANFRRCAKTARRPKDVARCVTLVQISMECHLNVLMGYLIQQSALDSGGRPVYTPECKVARLIGHASRRRSPPSIYACFADWIAANLMRCGV